MPWNIKRLAICLCKDVRCGCSQGWLLWSGSGVFIFTFHMVQAKYGKLTIFRLHTQGEILALLQSKPGLLLLSVSTIVSLLSQLFIFPNFEKAYDICILATIITFNKFFIFAIFSSSHQQSRNSQRLTVEKRAEVPRAKTAERVIVIVYSGQNVLKNSVIWVFFSSNVTWMKMLLFINEKEDDLILHFPVF